MATRINVNISGFDIAALKQRADTGIQDRRTTYVEQVRLQETKKRAEKLRKIDEKNSNVVTLSGSTIPSSKLPAKGSEIFGSRRRSRYYEEELAAMVLNQIDFAYIDANETYLTGLGGADPDVLYNRSNLILPTAANLQDYKIIRVIITEKDDFCVTANPNLPINFFFGYRAPDFARYVQGGGILWINTEYSGCGYPSSQFDSFLANVFGSSMSTNGTTYSADEEFIADPFSLDESFTSYVQKFPLTYAPLASSAPPIFYTQATALVFGGTPIYGKQIGESGFGAPIAFERIGNGYLVLSGDSNGTTQFPSYSSNGKTFVDALLQLEGLRP